MWRNWTIQLVESLDENLLDNTPKGFSNNIRWNIGHISVGWDQLYSPISGWTGNYLFSITQSNNSLEAATFQRERQLRIIDDLLDQGSSKDYVNCFVERK